MSDDDEAVHWNNATQLQKQKEALAKSKSVLQRPAGRTKSPQPESAAINQPPPITYPEFAPAHSDTAPRLVTLRRLLLVLYLSAGAATTMYIVSKLFLQPLVRRVVAARRDFQNHALLKLTLLADQLQEYSDVIQSDSNEQLTSEASVPQKLSRISDILDSQSKNNETAAHNELSFATEDLLVYLNGLVYSSTSYGTVFGLNSDDNTKRDLYNRVKTEIRSVKGAVLNIRNFPAPVWGSK